MKLIKLEGSVSTYDVKADYSIVDDEWKLLFIDLATEYWQTLFDNCGNNHPFRSAFGQQLSKQKRIQQCKDLMLSKAYK